MRTIDSIIKPMSGCVRKPGARGLSALIGIAQLWASALLGQFLEPVQIVKSVVKIEVRRAEGKSVGTGFVWSKPNYVVTALHVVAGANDNAVTVFSQSPSAEGSKVIEKSSTVKLLKFHHAADLALLELKENLGLVPLKLGTPNLNQDHEIWGFPKAIPEMKSDRVRFSKGVTTKPTFAAFFETKAAFEKQVSGDGFPKYESQILRVSDITQPGHSGAPIFDPSGQVVGIVDGGLYEGTKRINWAIPAVEYVPKLETSPDPLPGKPSLREARFSFVSAERNAPKDIELGASASREPVLAAKEAPRSEAPESTVLHYAWSAPLAEIFSTASEEDLEILQELEAVAPDLGQSVVEVYEDHETGATVAVPEGVSHSYDEAGRMLHAWSESKQVEMIIQVAGNESWEDGETAKDVFDLYIESLDGEATWQEDPDMPDEKPHEEEGYWSWEKSRIVSDEDGGAYSQLYATLIIDDGDFLGTAVFVRNLNELSEEDEKLLHVMMACVELSGFSIE